MDTVFRSQVLSLDDTTIEALATAIFEEDSSDIKSQTNSGLESSRDYKRSNSSKSYTVDYGPIRIRHRRSISQTLATGRRSKDEQLEGEEAIKREIRRAKNRTAARELKAARDKIEAELIQQIKELEEEKNALQEKHKRLEERKAQLSRAVYNAKQALLVPLVADMTMSLLSELQEEEDCLNDIQPLLNTIGEYFALSD